ncbi:hypothetical protein NCCP2716_19480 [Sporosarcina sp. NCCP-2716]|uniref:protoporphyrinogen oxidase n=1 Tax=Sporosarcina sp. NCCP-2716 TaxID=2943679 RepID=UPI00203BAFE6|nr:protoporphyrinogen oxidase [Sporosarcina sp. NCCP-2716]GKV69450.1 hypothetical protein NCCP2716_19480 [Sporosarcina sp. NCCP-2716]
MITKWLKTYIETNSSAGAVPLNAVQKEFAEKHALLPEGASVVPAPPFSPAYSLSDKETDEERTPEQALSNTPVSYVKQHPGDYVYAEEPLLSTVGIDGVSLEVDDVFGTVTALFGLRVQKKYGEQLKTYIDSKLGTAPGTRSLMFSNEDGLWDVNIALDYAEGFSEDFTFDETVQFLYDLVFRMLAELEEEA